MTGKPKRHNLADWLALHDLDPSLCRQILSAATRQVGSQPADYGKLASEEDALDPDDAWLTVVDAMCAFFPTRRSIIEDTFDKTSKVRSYNSNKTRRALTIDNGDGAYPTVIYTYFGRASDLMVVAHEFAHAVQIASSSGRFVTPIIREVCAFVGEAALLTHSRNIDNDLYLRLCQIWSNDDNKYLMADGEELNAALNNPDSVYRYCWNYPIARYLAIEISRKCTQERMWMLFEGDLSVRQILPDVES